MNNSEGSDRLLVFECRFDVERLFCVAESGVLPVWHRAAPHPGPGRTCTPVVPNRIGFSQSTHGKNRINLLVHQPLRKSVQKFGRHVT